MSAAERKSNRLIKEKSPYLLQHAYNPIDWYPWGEEAFAKAREEDKPIFFSCGYSTCHWCHVMERESFEDEEVAKVLNEYYVAIKVDREERPDIDQIYMTVCQAMTGSGGWPLTVLMTADKEPFFAGTYYPKNSKWGRPGLLDILTTIHKEWTQNKDKIVRNSKQITKSIQSRPSPAKQELLERTVLDQGYRQLVRDFDKQYGGFGQAPKFPIPHNLLFLMRYWRKTGSANALEMVKKTLDSMRRGGIYDHLGYGFSRYSTDPLWLVPHFEKMAYDNALLCYAYVEGYQCTHNDDYARVVREIIDYVLRDMTAAEGGFLSAEDADSEGVEGKFYVWTRQEVLELLGPTDGQIFCEFYDISEQGNFEHSNILNYIDHDYGDIAGKYNMKVADLENLLHQCRRNLFKVREQRVHPFKDDKILTAWNGLMIAALAKAARVLDCREYSAAAERALDFIYKQLFREDGRLLARYRDGQAAFPGYLEDYAFLLWGIVELFETVQNPELLLKATALAGEMKRLFEDVDNGGFFYYGLDNEQLIVRPKEIYDGAIPSGNSLAAYALLRLARITGDNEWESTVESMLTAFAAQVQGYPQAHTFFLMAVDEYYTPPQHCVIVGNQADQTVQAMWREVAQHFTPDLITLVHDSAEDRRDYDLLPAVQGKETINGKPAAYICRNLSCQSPIQDIGQFKQALQDYDR